MGNDPVSGVDPNGGYSYLGAKWRQAAASLWGNDPGKVYKSGSEWGFNTSSGSSFTGHFGPQRANPETENLINQIDVHYQRGQYNPRTGYIEGSGAVEANYIEFDAALAYFTWGAGNEFEVAAKGGVQYTKSSLQLGQQMHKAYKVGDVVEGVAMKEFRGIPGIRPDFVDFSTKTIYELKPFNPRAMQQGLRQLGKYQSEFEKVYGGTWKTILDTYK